MMVPDTAFSRAGSLPQERAVSALTTLVGIFRRAPPGKKNEPNAPLVA